MKKRIIINNIILALGVLCVLYYLGMGFAVRFGQSLLWLWPLMGAVCIIRWLLVRKSLKTGEPVPLPLWFITVWRICLTCGFALLICVQCFIVSAAVTTPPDGLDCIIVLGAKVNGTSPSGALYQRICAAEDYLSRNRDTICIASGGQGEDEGISEAECIRQGLTAFGIADERIIIEDSSVDTQTNFINSFSLLSPEWESIGVVTNDFHMLRALWNARQLSNLSISGVPAQSTAWGYIHYSLREFCAVVVGVLTGELAI